MRAKLIVEGREFDIEINDLELEKLVKPPKKTGYERLDIGYSYCTVGRNGLTEQLTEMNDDIDTMIYDAANYYSDKTVAENNARADKLMRRLRRFAAFQRNENLDWDDAHQCKYCICYNYYNAELYVVDICNSRHAFNIYFHSESCANAAIDLLNDELIWYFTEYKDSL
jgi:hypothetical protein